MRARERGSRIRNCRRRATPSRLGPRKTCRSRFRRLHRSPQTPPAVFSRKYGATATTTVGPAASGRRDLSPQFPEHLRSVGVGGIEGEGLLVARDGSVALAVFGVGFAEAVMDVPGGGKVCRVHLEDCHSLLDLLPAEEPVADPVDLLFGQGRAGAVAFPIAVTRDGRFAAGQDVLEPGPRRRAPAVVLEPGSGR